MLDNTYPARKYHAGKYIPCWKIHTMLDNTYHAGKYIPYWKVHTMLDNTYHAGQYIPLFYDKKDKSCLLKFISLSQIACTIT
jgi:hypothetical protein